MSNENAYVSCCGGYVYHEFVEMKGGAKVFCLVAKPKQEGSFPTVINQCGYHFPAARGFTAEYYTMLIRYGSGEDLAPFIDGGYAVVLMDSRGTGNSQWPEWMPYQHETSDQGELFDWVRRQDFYNGELFCTGNSYMGFTSGCTFAVDHHDVKAVHMSMPVGRRYDCWYHKGFVNVGCMCNWQTVNHRPRGADLRALFMNVASSSAHRPMLDRFNKFPYLSWPKDLYYYQEPYWTDILTHPEDGEWWRNESCGHEIYKAMENIDVPVLLWENFYDIFYDNTMNVWNELPEHIRAKSAFVVNQYGHSSFAGKWPWEGQWPYDHSKRYVLDFFNSVRNKTAPQNLTLGAITYTPVADGLKQYVEPGVLSNGPDKHVLYLNDHTLDTVPKTDSVITYTYDPLDPARFSGSPITGNSDFYNYGGLGVDPAPGWRQDVVSFVAEPAEKAGYIKGQFNADIMVSSDCEDTCFIIRFDIVKGGKCYNLREDITSLSHELGTYIPGTPVKLHLDTSPIVVKIEPGDYLRIDISSSAAGMYALHTNVAGKQYEIAEPKIARNSIHCGESSILFYTADRL